MRSNVSSARSTTVTSTRTNVRKNMAVLKRLPGHASTDAQMIALMSFKDRADAEDKHVDKYKKTAKDLQAKEKATAHKTHWLAERQLQVKERLVAQAECSRALDRLEASLPALRTEEEIKDKLHGVSSRDKFAFGSRTFFSDQRAAAEARDRETTEINETIYSLQMKVASHSSGRALAAKAQPIKGGVLKGKSNLVSKENLASEEPLIQSALESISNFSRQALEDLETEARDLEAEISELTSSINGAGSSTTNSAFSTQLQSLANTPVKSSGRGGGSKLSHQDESASSPSSQQQQLSPGRPRPMSPRNLVGTPEKQTTTTAGGGVSPPSASRAVDPTAPLPLADLNSSNGGVFGRPSTDVTMNNFNQRHLSSVKTLQLAGRPSIAGPIPNFGALVDAELNQVKVEFPKVSEELEGAFATVLHTVAQDYDETLKEAVEQEHLNRYDVLREGECEEIYEDLPDSIAPTPGSEVGGDSSVVATTPRSVAPSMVSAYSTATTRTTNYGNLTLQKKATKADLERALVLMREYDPSRHSNNKRCRELFVERLRMEHPRWSELDCLTLIRVAERSQKIRKKVSQIKQSALTELQGLSGDFRDAVTAEMALILAKKAEEDLAYQEEIKRQELEAKLEKLREDKKEADALKLKQQLEEEIAQKNEAAIREEQYQAELQSRVQDMIRKKELKVAHVEEERLKQVAEAEKAKEKKAEESVINAARVEFRKQRQEQREATKKLEKEIKSSNEQKKAEALHAFFEKCDEKTGVERDTARAIQGTVSSTQEEMVRPLVGEANRKLTDGKMHGYSEAQIVKDPRYRLQQALVSAGLHTTAYGRQVLMQGAQKGSAFHTSSMNPLRQN